MTDPELPSSERPTQPRDRFRRLVTSSEEDNPGLQPTPQESPETPPEEPAPSPPSAESPEPAAVDEQAGETPLQPDSTSTPQDLASEEQPAGQRPEEESPSGTTAPPAPESSPAEDLAAPQSPPASEPPDRHPTGHPESTGGWYGQELEGQPPSEGTQPTQPVRVSPSQSTRVVPVTPRPPAPTQDNAPTIPPPAVDEYGMPLPRRVDEIDMNATRVSPVAYNQSKHTPPSEQRPTAPGHPASRTPTQPPTPFLSTTAARRAPLHKTQPIKPQRSGLRKTAGCLLRGLIGLLFLAVLAVVVAGSVLVYQYYTIAASLPSVSDLQQRASQFETTRILDRNGNLLYEILDPNAGKRTYTPLDKISPYLIAATLATEDKDFYTHPGFNVLAIVRALWQNYTTGETVSGASTITQQLARALLLTPEERSQQTVQRKAREIILAAEITRRYTKDEILELYLNENYYGNLAYGIEAAAETYFNTTADKLDLAQASFLAGLPQAPAVYDVYNNRDETLRRQKTVLVLMYQDSQEKNCIEVSTSVQPVCVDATAVADAANEIENYNFTPPTGNMRYPHWVNYVRSLLEAQFDPQTIYRSGFTVYTTLDPGLQDQAEQIVSQQVTALAAHNVSDGALVAIQPNTGEILAMVGSADFYNDAISGQVNMAVSPRQPGSSIKPLTYVAAFEKGWTPSTLIWDVPSEFPPSGDPDDTSPPYKPVDYDGTFHGPVTVRTPWPILITCPR